MPTAYGVKSYQVKVPAWLDCEQYEITGELPDGKAREQAKFMLQNLLAERFGLKMHRETKEMAVYCAKDRQERVEAEGNRHRRRPRRARRP